MLQKRSDIIKRVRSFFDDRGYLELDTPLLSDNLIPESCLEVFQTQRLTPYGGKIKNSPLWLIPSPEIWMKKIIGEHNVNVFQICKCFRNGESTGFLHNHEFTMLEYYTVDADYIDSLAITEELFEYLTTNHHEPFKRMTIKDAFERYAGFDLFDAAEKGADEMAQQARKLGLDPMPGLSIPALYDLIFIHVVEPRLKTDKPIALLDYPAFVPCFAKKSPDGKTTERWELYCNGIELANCFSEETNPQKVKDFFTNEEAAKEKSAIVKHKIDKDYWKIFESRAGKDFPRCSGVALGLDRLIMLLTLKSTINSVLPFFG